MGAEVRVHRAARAVGALVVVIGELAVAAPVASASAAAPTQTSPLRPPSASGRKSDHPKLASSLADDAASGRPVNPMVATDAGAANVPTNSVTVVVKADDTTAARQAVEHNGAGATVDVRHSVQAQVPADRIGPRASQLRLRSRCAPWP